MNVDLTSEALRAERAQAVDRRTVVFYVEVLEALRPHADARDMHVNELVRLLIDRIVDDELVGAILDDGENDA